MYTVNKRKINFNREDDKKKIQRDRITTLARGYLA